MFGSEPKDLVAGASRFSRGSSALGPLARRALLWLGLAPLSAVTFVLLMADRAPAYAESRAIAAWSYGSKIQNRFGVDVFHAPRSPMIYEKLLHLMLWFVLAALVTVLFAQWFRLRWIGAALLAASAVSEVAQRLLTSDRNMELTDALANGLGVAVGVVSAACLLAVIDRGTGLAA